MASTQILKSHSIQNKQATPTFSQFQIDYLDKQFPNFAQSPEVSEAMLRYTNGQRSVLDHIKSKVG